MVVVVVVEVVEVVVVVVAVNGCMVVFSNVYEPQAGV
jgi:hypothetical protein